MQHTIEKETGRTFSGEYTGHRKLRVYFLPLLVLGAAMLLMNGQAVLRDIGFIEFKTLLVTGDFKFVKVEQVQDVAKSYAKSGFLTVDLVALREAVKQIEWVQGARVRREWPATLVIEITEEVPVAVWRGQKLLSANGEIFGDARNGFETLPKLAGPEGTQFYLLSRYGEFKAILGNTELDFSTLTLSNRRSFELETLSGIRVILGADEIDDRLRGDGPSNQDG